MESDSIYNGIIHVEMSQNDEDSLDGEEINPLSISDVEDDPLACDTNPFEDCPNQDSMKFEPLDNPLQFDALSEEDDAMPDQKDVLPLKHDNINIKIEGENYDSDSEPGDLEIDSGTFSDSLNDMKADPDADENDDLEAASLVKVEFGEEIVKKETGPVNDQVMKEATLTNEDGVKIYTRKLPEHTYHSHLITKENIQHEDSTAKTKNKVFTCKHCLFKTLYKKIYVTHMRKIHSILVFACELCNFHYTTKEVTQEHIKIKHKIFKFYDCPKCDHFCLDEKKVKYHMRLSHSKSKLNCPYCTYKSDCKANINRHIKSVHSLIKPFKCDSCNYSTTCQLFLSSHVKRKHSKAKIYACSFCPERFVHQNYLAKHIQILHMGSDYKCSFCAFTSPLHAKLRNHLVNEHADKAIFLNADNAVEKQETKTEVAN